MALPEFSPSLRLLDRNHIVTHSGGKMAIPYDVMRTRLLQQMRVNGWRRLAVTSPGSSCGKTTTCINLAFSFARQSDVHTVVAEIDLRRPAMAKMLGMRGQHFAKVLDCSAPFEKNAMRVGSNLCFATHSGSARNPAELLQNERLPEALAEIEARYQPTLTIFDMPPMLVSDDTLAFVEQVDCALLIAAADSTTTHEIDSCEKELAAQTNLLGVVLNKCRYMDKSYGYSYYG